jgi:uncharacterized DUF497 family protein
MEIDFDPSKSEWNRRERGFGFSYAARVFIGPHTVETAKVVDGEPRMKAIGEIEGELYAVVFVDRGEVRRIVSARPASRKERREWNPSE